MTHSQNTSIFDPNQLTSLSEGSKWRIDSGIELGEVTETEEGFLILTGVAARAGVLTYIEDDGSERKELVPPSTLKESAQSIEGKPLSNEHPERGEIVPENWSDEAVGAVIEAEFEDGDLKVRIRVNARRAKQDVRAGKRQLSPGYAADLEETSGEHPEYGEYDLIQVSRAHNHLALTEAAREPTASIRLDSKGHAMDVKRNDSSDEKQDEMDGESKEDAPEEGGEESSGMGRIEAMLEQQQEQLSEMSSALQDLAEVMKDGEESEEEPEEGESEGGEESEDGESEEERMDWFEERRDALNQAERLNLDVDNDSDLSVIDIKRKCVEKETGERLDSDDEVRAAFKIMQSEDGKPSFGAGAFTPSEPTRNDDEDKDGNKFEELESRKKQRDQFQG